jgi:hypothetical protein
MEIEKSSLDAKLLSMARKSPQEIADATGLDARFIAERISQLLESRDWLTERQQERLLLEEVIDLKDKVMEMLELGDPRMFAANASVALKTMKLVSERIDARRKLVNQDINEITNAQARIFGKAFDVALQHIVSNMKKSDELPEPEDIDAWVSDGLRMAARELSEHVISE